jgi:hypothetical protein
MPNMYVMGHNCFVSKYQIVSFLYFSIYLDYLSVLIIKHLLCPLYFSIYLDYLSVLIIKHLLCPRHIMAGAYSVTLFRHSVIPSSSVSFIILVTVAHIQIKFDIWICHEKIQVKFEFGHRSMNFGRVMSLLL